VSFLPGINVTRLASDDGRATLETRRLLREIGSTMIPDYLWIGRGFGQSSAVDLSTIWDPTTVTAHINQGKFYNGIIGLLVNTGIMGTVFMFVFLGAGTALATKTMRLVHIKGCEDSFSLVCSVIAGLWMSNVIAFLFLHGDSEYAMKTFSLQAGLLLTCHYHLQQRELTRENQP
jgi:O-antigen ligase